MRNRSLGDEDHLLGHDRWTVSEQRNDVVGTPYQLAVERVHLVLKTVEAVRALRNQSLDVLVTERSQVDETTVDDVFHSTLPLWDVFVLGSPTTQIVLLK